MLSLLDKYEKTLEKKPLSSLQLWAWGGVHPGQWVVRHRGNAETYTTTANLLTWIHKGEFRSLGESWKEPRVTPGGHADSSQTNSVSAGPRIKPTTFLLRGRRANDSDGGMKRPCFILYSAVSILSCFLWYIAFLFFWLKTSWSYATFPHVLMTALLQYSALCRCNSNELWSF